MDDPEAFLFFTFIDETKGEDYLTFFLHCMQVLEGMNGHLLRKQFGPTQHGMGGHCTSFTRLTEAIHKFNILMGSSVEESSTASNSYGCGAAQAIWIPLTVAERTVAVVLNTSPDGMVEEALSLTRRLAVDCKDRLSDADATDYCIVLEEDDVSIGGSVSLDDSAASVDSAGIAIAKDDVVVKKQCVNMFLFLRHIMEYYEKESAHRRASVRLMFETASTGALTEDMPHGGVEDTGFSTDEQKYVQHISLAGEHLDERTPGQRITQAKYLDERSENISLRAQPVLSRSTCTHSPNLYSLAQPVLTRPTCTHPVLTLALFLSCQPSRASHLLALTLASLAGTSTCRSFSRSAARCTPTFPFQKLRASSGSRTTLSSPRKCTTSRRPPALRTTASFRPPSSGSSSRRA